MSHLRSHSKKPLIAHEIFWNLEELNAYHQIHDDRRPRIFCGLQHWYPNSYCIAGCFQKEGYPKMDGENNGKPYFLMDDLGGKPTILGNTQLKNSWFLQVGSCPIIFSFSFCLLVQLGFFCPKDGSLLLLIRHGWQKGQGQIESAIYFIYYMYTFLFPESYHGAKIE